MLNKTPYTAIYFSGVEGDRFIDTAYRFADCRHMLMSILYVEQKGTQWFDNRCKKYPDVRFMIDSGGHSFRREGFCPKWPDWTWFDNFADRYRDWLLQNKHLIDLCVNLDIDCLDKANPANGMAKMLEYDERIFRPLEREGVPVCYVWHDNYGFDFWLKMCREHEFVGLPGNLEEAEYHKLLRPAMMNGCRVHGFGCTKANTLGKVPFATVDSSVAGHSRLLLDSAEGRYMETIENLFGSCSVYHQTTPTEIVGELQAATWVHTLDDNLQPVFARVRGVIQHKVKKRIVRVTLQGGKTIEGTDDHSFFTLDKDGALIETKPTDLRVGDCLVASMGSKAEKATPWTFRHTPEFEGVWFGDGHVSKEGYVHVSFGGEEEILRLCQDTAARYDAACRVKPNGMDLVIYSKPLGKHLSETFGRVGAEKHLDAVHRYSRESRARFLKGWFSADGTTSGNHIELTACYSSDLCHQAQMWLEDYDIRASYNAVETLGGFKPHTIRRIAICDLQSRRNFASAIGFIQSRKNKGIKLDVNKYPLARGRRGLPVDLLRSDRLYTVSGKLSEKGRPVTSRDKRVVVNPRNFSDTLLHGQFEYTEILSIEVISEDKEVMVYDLSVAGYERFFAEGILAHNTTWKSGERFGQTFVFESSKLNVYDHNNKEVRQRYKSQWIAKGVDWDLLEQDKAEAITQVAAIAWGQLQDHIRTMSGKLAYWMKTSRLLDDLGDPDQMTLATFMRVLRDVQCPLVLKTEDEAKSAFEEARWFLGRHPEVMAMSDEDLTWWVKHLGAEPENTSRGEVEASIRQRLYDWFYKISAIAAKPRLDEDSVVPVKVNKPRAVEPADVEVGDVEPPDISCAPSLETTTEKSPVAALPAPPVVEDNPITQAELDAVDLSQPIVDTGFILSVEDRVLRSRASLALDLLFEQHKHRHEADTLKRLHIRKQRMLECRKRVASLAGEITAQVDQLPERLAESVRRAADEAFQKWVEIQGDEDAAHRERQRQAMARRPQNRALALRASEIGRLGGAPKGNQNARKHGLTSKKMPVLACDNCPHVQVCEHYRAGHQCAYTREFEAPLVGEENETPEVAAIRQVLEAQIKRARRSLVYETFEGGILNKATTVALKDAARTAQILHAMKHPVAAALGRMATQPADQQPRSDGILAQLFGGLASAAASAKDTEAKVVGDGT